MTALPPVGTVVSWYSPFAGWRFGSFLGLAPGDNGKGDPFVAIRAANGIVHVRLSALS
jgi:hypothetical protein